MTFGFKFALQKKHVPTITKKTTLSPLLQRKQLSQTETESGEKEKAKNFHFQLIKIT